MASGEPPWVLDAAVWGDLASAANAVLAEAARERGPARIAHPPAYAHACALLRALVAAGEAATPRVLAAAAAVIDANPAHYSAWSVRRAWFEAAARSQDVWEAEVAYTSRIIDATSKNYQVWNHRRWVQTRLLATAAAAAAAEGGGGEHGTAGAALVASERAFTAGVIDTDSKHYHAWAHRQWVLGEAGSDADWADELVYTARLLEDDVRNNSAWHHRLLALKAVVPGRVVGGISAATRLAEVTAALAALRRASRNEAAWNFLRALLPAPTPPGAPDAAALALYAPPGPLRDALLPAVTSLVEAAEPDVNPFANEFLADLHVGDLLAAAPPLSPTAAGPTLRTIARLHAAAADVDAVRAAYWAWRAALVAAAFPAAPPT